MDLGSIAAAVQFVDLGCRSLFGIYRFIKDLNDVPAELLLLFEDLGHFLSLVGELQSAVKPESGVPPQHLSNLAPAQLERIARILNSTGQVCRQLEQALTPCRPSVGASKAKAAWRAVVSVKRERGIVKKCERLERLKHDLTRELQNSGLALLSSVK